MERDTLVARLRSDLERAFGPRFLGVVLFGSEARGDSQPDSDVDVLVLLEGPVALAADTRLAVRAVFPLCLEIDRPIHPIPVQRSVFESSDSHFYAAVRRDGILA